MELLLLLGGLFFAGVLVVCGILAVVVHAALWVILLPFRLVGALLFLPLWIAGVLVKALFTVLILPALAVVAVVGGGAILLFTLAAPLLLLGLLFVIVVMIVKALTAAPAVA